MSSPVLEFALQYASHGWRVVPVHGIREPGVCACSLGARCPSPGKRPHPKEWQKAGTTDEEVIASWWGRWPQANCGIVLGEHSNLIDVECDSPEAEELLLKLFDGDIPVVPTFAGVRGKHRLFVWSRDLPFPDKAVFKLGELEFRTGNGARGAQSVFPPSRHATGKQYEWLVRPEDCDPAPLPASVIARVMVYVSEGELDAPPGEARPREHWDRIAQGVGEGNRNNDAASLIGKMLGSLADPFDNSAVAVQWELAQAWNHRNTPPIEARELKRTFDSILKRHRGAVTEQQHKRSLEKYVSQDRETGKPSESSWRLVKVLADPEYWKLFSPLWEHQVPGGYIEMDTEHLLSAAKLTVLAARKATVLLDLDFKRVWRGNPKKGEPGLLDQLMKICEFEAASPEEIRSFVLAAAVWDEANKNLQERDEADPRGQFVRLALDQSVWFKQSWLRKQLTHMAEPPSAAELAKLLKKLGARDLQHRNSQNKQNARYTRMSPAAWRRLERAATACKTLCPYPPGGGTGPKMNVLAG